MINLGFPGGSDVKESVCNAGDQVRSLDQEDPLEKEIVPTLVFLPGKSNRQKSLAGYGPWGYKESDLIERLCVLRSLRCQGMVRSTST